MGTRASRLQEDAAPSAFGKDGTKRESYRRTRCARPTSLMVDFSGSFEDAEPGRSRSEEGSDSDPGQHGASADGSPADHHSIPSSISQASPADDDGSEGKAEEDGNISPAAPGDAEHPRGEETGRTPHRTFSERLPGNRHSSARSVGARSARVRGAHQRPVSEAWIGLYRVNNRHASRLTFLLMRCSMFHTCDCHDLWCTFKHMFSENKSSWKSRMCKCLCLHDQITQHLTSKCDESGLRWLIFPQNSCYLTGDRSGRLVQNK